MLAKLTVGSLLPDTANNASQRTASVNAATAVPLVRPVQRNPRDHMSFALSIGRVNKSFVQRVASHCVRTDESALHAQSGGSRRRSRMSEAGAARHYQAVEEQLVAERTAQAGVNAVFLQDPSCSWIATGARQDQGRPRWASAVHHCASGLVLEPDRASEPPGRRMQNSVHARWLIPANPVFWSTVQARPIGLQLHVFHANAMKGRLG